MPEQPITDRFAGSLKPMCGGCWRRVYGIARGDGWWCQNCEDWIVKPRKARRGKRAGTRKEPR